MIGANNTVSCRARCLRSNNEDEVSVALPLRRRGGSNEVKNAVNN